MRTIPRPRSRKWSARILAVSVLALLVAAGVASGQTGGPSVPLERIAVPIRAAANSAPSIWDFAETPGGDVFAAVTDPSFGRGDFLATRLHPDGSLDESFGEGGFTAPIKRPGGAQATGIATVPGGGFVLVGYRTFHRRALIARFASDGQPVQGFAHDGVAELAHRYSHSTPTEALHGVAVAAGGRILTVGAIREAHPGVSKPEFGEPEGVVAAYRPSGKVDTTFGDDGHVYFARTKATAGGRGYTGLRSIVIQPDGKILVAGFERADLIVARLLPDGAPDLSFGHRGRITVKVDDPGVGCVGSCPAATPISLRPDGKILVLHSDSDEAPALVRLLPDGRLDRGFGKRGVARLNGGHYFLPYSMAIAGGRIYLAGWEEKVSEDVDFAYSVHRLRLDGTPDRSFGRGGIERRTIGDASAAFATLPRPSGEVWVGGSQSGDSPNELLLARYRAPSG
jgi:uncharacterized delta-60 repeat protein